MGYDMNSGYSGYSMSKRAVGAYEDGEMPASKWTKAAMLSSINGYLDAFDLACDLNLGAMRKDELFKQFFCLSSWHHTSKFCRETDFYAIDEDALCDVARDMTPDELAKRGAHELDEQEAHDAPDAESSRQEARLDALRGLVMERTGCVWGTLGAYASIFPERLLSSHTSRRGNLVLTVRAPDEPPSSHPRGRFFHVTEWGYRRQGKKGRAESPMLLHNDVTLMRESITRPPLSQCRRDVLRAIPACFLVRDEVNNRVAILSLAERSLICV